MANVAQPPFQASWPRKQNLKLVPVLLGPANTPVSMANNAAFFRGEVVQPVLGGTNIPQGPQRWPI